VIRSCRRFLYPKRFSRVAYLIDLLETIVSAQTDLQASIDALTASNVTLTTAVDAAVAALGSPVSGVPEGVVSAAAASVKTLADAVAANAARLAAAPVVTAPAA
jgi:hypothetical protein